MKVFFAGSESDKVDQQIHAAGIRNRLNSFFYLKSKSWDKLKYLNLFDHLIIDSGLFTIMFGGAKDKEFTDDDMYAWFELYMNFINNNHFKNANFVELDVQRVKSSELAWDLRREMKKRVNKGTIINVYHLPDENPDKLIDYADFIAISHPELRKHVTEKERYELVKYISVKAALKGKRCHHLGMTEKKYMQDFSFSFSADSTSWLSALRYGEVKTKSFNCKYNKIRTETDPDTQMLAMLFEDDYKNIMKFKL